MRDTLPEKPKMPAEEPDHRNGSEPFKTNGASTSYALEDDSEIIVPKRRRVRWPLLLAALLVVALAVGAALIFLPGGKSVPTATVHRGTIISSVETTGKVDASKSVRIAFKSGGLVQRVLVKQGDTVKTGQVLAELDTSVLQRQLQQAQLQLDISNLKLQQARQNPQPQDVAAAQANLNAALAQLDQVKAGANPQDIAAAQALLNQAQSKLDAVKRGPTTQDVAVAQAELDQAKSNRDLVAARGANATQQARIALDQAKAANPDLLDPTGVIEQARLNYQTAQQSETAQNNIADAQVRQAQAALDKLRAGASSDEIKQAEEAVAQAQANLDKLKAGPTVDQLKQAQSQVDAAQAQLDKVNAGPSEIDLTVLEEQVKLSQVSVDGAQAALNDARLVAPMDGTVLAMDVDPGELVGGQQGIATIADTGSLRITGDIDEMDVGRVSPGQAVTVTLDAYPGVKMPARVETLAPGATFKQGSTVYQATISFITPSSVVARQGMAANVDITSQRKDNVLLLPNRAFETVGNRQYVTVQQSDGSTRKVEVETGLSNASDTEVLSGVSDGQVVLLK